MADKASSSNASSSTSSQRRPSKYPQKGKGKKPFVDPKMKDVIVANLKKVLGKLDDITEIIVTRNKELGGENVKQPKIIEALREANAAFKKLEEKKFNEEHKK